MKATLPCLGLDSQPFGAGGPERGRRAAHHLRGLRLFACVCVLAGAAACTPPGISTAPPPQARSFNLTVTGSKMAPTDHLRVYEGDTITITVAADKEEDIHLHGYDRLFHPKPGTPATISFKADRSGSFEIEIEESSIHLGDLEVDPR